jgi:hypothetical protein
VEVNKTKIKLLFLSRNLPTGANLLNEKFGTMRLSFPTDRRPFDYCRGKLYTLERDYLDKAKKWLKTLGLTLRLELKT